jgi:hypothetical protein
MANNAKARPFLSREEWLAKKAARRERQRAVNLTRAAQMHEARLAQEQKQVAGED